MMNPQGFSCNPALWLSCGREQCELAGAGGGIRPGLPTYEDIAKPSHRGLLYTTLLIYRMLQNFSNPLINAFVFSRGPVGNLAMQSWWNPEVEFAGIFFCGVYPFFFTDL